MDITLIAAGTRPWHMWLHRWGLSYLIDGTILFDTFERFDVLERKLNKVGVTPSAITSIVISHEHEDHVDGMWGLIEKRPGTDVYLPPTASISLKQRITTAGGHLIDTPGTLQIKENIWVMDEIIGTCKGKPIAEQSVVVKNEKGLILIVGCSHPNIIKIIKKAKETFGLPVYAVTGGLHLMHSSKADIHTCVDALKAEGVQAIAPSHCTGIRAERALKKVFGEGFVSAREGKTLSL